jgi:ADP-ribose pyrophosphatase YjhB (NUDIX family)
MAEPLHNSRKNDDILYISAGTAVFDKDDKLLLVLQSNNIWSLPKGSVKNGETIYEAACRETAEEAKVDIGRFVPYNIKTYELHDKPYYIFIYKITDYDEIPKNNTAINTNGTQQIKWVPKEEWTKILNKKCLYEDKRVNKLTSLFLKDVKNIKFNPCMNDMMQIVGKLKMYKNNLENTKYTGGKRKTIRSKHYKRYQNKTKKRKLT